jgi:hypothetical protein
MQIKEEAPSAAAQEESKAEDSDMQEASEAANQEPPSKEAKTEVASHMPQPCNCPVSAQCCLATVVPLQSLKALDGSRLAHPPLRCTCRVVKRRGRTRYPMMTQTFWSSLTRQWADAVSSHSGEPPLPPLSKCSPFRLRSIAFRGKGICILGPGTSSSGLSWLQNDAMRLSICCRKKDAQDLAIKGPSSCMRH